MSSFVTSPTLELDAAASMLRLSLSSAFSTDSIDVPLNPAAFLNLASISTLTPVRWLMS